MKTINKFLLFFLGVGMPLFSYAQDITPQMIQKAKAVGISEAQIGQALGKNVSKSPSNPPPDSSLGKSSGLRSVQREGGPATEEVPVGPETIFGSEIFGTQRLSFEPNFNLPTPQGYVLSAGDQLLIEIWGAAEASYQRTISPDGVISLPSVGVIFLSGQTVDQARKTVESKLSSAYAGLETGEVNVRVSLGQIRSIKVNIAGNAKVPGTYTLPSLATLFNALYMAGGVSEIGSLRDIDVYRANKRVAHLDVYEYIVNGQYSSNITLEDNDMVIVNPYQSHVKITGKVKRNRVFELKKGETLSHLVKYAGGFTGDAYTENVTVDRKAGRFYQVHTVDRKDFDVFAMQDCDSVTVGAVIDQYDNRISVRGAVWRPGAYQLSGQTGTVKKLIEKAEGLQAGAYFDRAILSRRNEDGTYRAFSLDIPAILSGRAEDLELKNGDELYVPFINGLKEAPYIVVRGEVNGIGVESDEGKLKQNIELAKSGHGIATQWQDGQVRMNYMEGMTVADAIVLSGGFKDAASQAFINVVRRTKDPLSTTFPDKQALVFEVTLQDGLAFDKAGKEFRLEPFDEIIVRRSPAYIAQQFVSVGGEVLFTGSFNMKKNMRLSDLVESAGGFTPYAYAKGAQLRRKLSEADLAKLESKFAIMQNANGKDSLSTDMPANLPTFYPVGIDLEKAMKNKGGLADVILQEGDELIVPQFVGVVKISGAVVYPNAVTFEKGKKLKEYIRNAGGYAQNARKKAFVIYANGQVETVHGGIFRKNPEIKPGCEIVVPMKTARRSLSMPEIMAMSTSVTSIAALISSMIRK